MGIPCQLAWSECVLIHAMPSRVAMFACQLGHVLCFFSLILSGCKNHISKKNYICPFPHHFLVLFIQALLVQVQVLERIENQWRE